MPGFWQRIAGVLILQISRRIVGRIGALGFAEKSRDHFNGLVPEGIIECNQICTNQGRNGR